MAAFHGRGPWRRRRGAANPSVSSLLDAGDQGAVAPAQLLEALGDRRMGLGIDDAESQLLELLAHVVHAHSPGQRRVNFQRLLGRPLARRLRHELQGAHVVEAVGELDEQDPDILGDGEQQLAEILRLRRLLRDEVELLDLGQSLDQPADILAEGGIDLAAGGVGILDGVVEERRRDGRVVEPQIGEDGRDFEGMGEIGIAVGALLAAMLLHGVDIGLVEQVLVRVGIIPRDPFDQLVLAHHGARVRRLNRPAAQCNRARFDPWAAI